MAIKELFLELETDVSDIVRLGFELINCQETSIPSYEDPVLTYEAGKTKTGRMIETCVLYADIRNSTTISQKYSRETLGKLYTAFIKSTIKAADYHGGSVRNIIGDRVMIVFPRKNCFQNAVDTAISINTISANIINKNFPSIDFKCGIGIDFGEMKAIKAGVIRQGIERTHYKNLVWIGNTANIASKLTDIAHKDIINYIFSVVYKEETFRPLFPSLLTHSPGFPSFAPLPRTEEMTGEEFIKAFSVNASGIQEVKGKPAVSIRKRESSIRAPAILITDAVYKGLHESHPESHYFKNSVFSKTTVSIKEYKGAIYGADGVWSLK